MDKTASVNFVHRYRPMIVIFFFFFNKAVHFFSKTCQVWDRDVSAWLPLLNCRYANFYCTHLLNVKVHLQLATILATLLFFILNGSFVASWEVWFNGFSQCFENTDFFIKSFSECGFDVCEFWSPAMKTMLTAVIGIGPTSNGQSFCAFATQR